MTYDGSSGMCNGISGHRYAGIGGVTEVPAEIRNGSGGGGGWGGRSQGDGIDVQITSIALLLR